MQLILETFGFFENINFIRLLLWFIGLYIAHDAFVRPIYDWIHVKLFWKLRYKSIKRKMRDMNATRLLLKHSYMFVMQKYNFYYRSVFVLWYCFKMNYGKYWGQNNKIANDKQIVKLFINTRSVQQIEASLNNFSYALFPNKKDCSFKMNAIITRLNTNVNNNNELIYDWDAQITKFSLNDIELNNNQERFSVVVHMIAYVLHPTVHSFSNQMYNEQLNMKKNDLKKYSNLFLYTQSLSIRAHSMVKYMFGNGKDYLKESVCFNAALKIPYHNFGLLSPLINISPYIRYCLKSRIIVYKLIQKYSVPIGVEPFFITSIVHSLDHYFMHLMIGFNMQNIILPKYRATKFFSYVFYPPARDLFNNLLKTNRNQCDFFNEMYTRLVDIDETFTDNVDVSISC